MRSFLMAAGLVGLVVVSVAFAGGGSEAGPKPDLAARVDALTKELEALRPLPTQIEELKERIRELELQVAIPKSQPVSAEAPSSIPKNAIPSEINGTTFYFIPVGSQASGKSRPGSTAKLP